MNPPPLLPCLIITAEIFTQALELLLLLSTLNGTSHDERVNPSEPEEGALEDDSSQPGRRRVN